MLLGPAPGKKAGALAVSLTAQTIAVGVLLLVPLLYNDRLPIVQPVLPLLVPLTPPAPPPVHQVPVHHAPRPTRPFSSGFYAPTKIPPLSTVPDIAGEPEPVQITGGPPPAIDGLQTLIRLVPVAPPAAPPKIAIDAAPMPTKPTLVGGAVQAAKLIKKIVPTYPAPARLVRVSGTVHLLGTISREGTIQQLQVISGHPLLVGAALEAVRQWVYQPTLLNGEAVEVVAPIDVVFTLGN